MTLHFNSHALTRVKCRRPYGCSIYGWKISFGVSFCDDMFCDDKLLFNRDLVFQMALFEIISKT